MRPRRACSRILILSLKNTSRRRCGISPLINRVIIRGIYRASSLRFRSAYVEIERTLILPKKMRLNDQSVYTAPKTILVTAKKVAQKF